LEYRAVVRKSQHIPIEDIAHALNPARKGHRHFLILEFYCDESYDSNIFTFGGFMAEEHEWTKLENKWNRRVKKAGVSRFHAAPLNCYDEEFESWRGTNKSKEFVVPLINIIKRRLLVGFSFAMILDDYEKYTSQTVKDKLGTPYLCCFKHCIAMAAQLLDLPPEDKIAVIIDRNPEELEAVKLFYKIKDDSNVPYRHRLASCIPGGWEDYTPLQPADMIAYDTFKLLHDKHVRDKHEWRKSLKAIYDSKPLFGKYFDRECFESISKKIEGRPEDIIIVEDQNDFTEGV
jgi:hypothetical protein